MSAGRSAAYGAARLKCARRAGEGKKPSGSDAATRYVRMRLRGRGARSAPSRESRNYQIERKGATHRPFLQLAALHSANALLKSFLACGSRLWYSAILPR